MAETQDRSKPPNADDLMKLSRWARVAFATRCARRVQPLFRYHWPSAPSQHLQGLERAISLSESSARKGRPESSLGAASSRAANTGASDLQAAAAASSAARAADAADYTDAANAAARAADAARFAVMSAGEAATDAITNALWVDYFSLVDLVVQKRQALQNVRSEDEEAMPIDVAELGDLWPHGLPAGWTFAHQPVIVSGKNSPQNSDSRHWADAGKRKSLKSYLPQLEIFMDPGNASADDIAEALIALSDAHRAAGGLGIEFRRQKARAFHMEEAPKP